MDPCGFDEANHVLGPPEGLREDQVGSLRCMIGLMGSAPVIISCFRATPADIAEIQRTGRVWLTVMGTGMPPVIVSSRKPNMSADEESEDE